MPTLPELQTAFRDGLLQGGTAEDAVLAHIAGDRDKARRRLAAYRRSVMGNLTAALESAYPVVAQLVGAPFFREAARQYLLAHPSGSGDLNELGESFPDFLEAYGPAQELPYLPDVARLEWQVQKVYFSPDGVPPDLSALERAGPDDSLHFTVTLAHARLDSPWPVERIWTLHQAGAEEFDVDLSQACHALVGRRDGRVFAQSLSAAEAAFFDALAAGDKLDSAVGAAFATDENFDLGSTFGRFLAQGYFPQAWLTPGL